MPRHAPCAHRVRSMRAQRDELRAVGAGLGDRAARLGDRAIAVEELRRELGRPGQAEAAFSGQMDRAPYHRAMTTHGANPGQVLGLDRQLSTSDLDLLDGARGRLRAIRRGSTLAAFNGCALAVCAVLCVPLASIDPALGPLAGALAVVAWAELRGRRLLGELDPRATGWLVRNQVATFLVVLAYCAWRIFDGLTGPSPSHLPELAAVLGGSAASSTSPLGGLIDRVYPTLVVAFYGAVVLCAAIFQAMCGMYYLGQSSLIAGHLQETPTWAQELQCVLDGRS